MKAKKRILYIGLALWMIAFLQMIHTGLNPVSEEEAIVTAFADNDFLNTVSTITASGNYKNIYLADSDREDLLLDLAHKLGISNSLVYDTVTEAQITTSSLIRSSDNVCTVLKLITTESRKNENEISFRHVLQVEIEFDNSLESAFYYKDLLRKAFESLGVNPDISVHLKGEMDGSLSMSQKNIISDNIIESSGGRIVTERRSDSLFTVYAYTDKIDDYVLNGSLKTNLNVAITYDEENDITEVYMATPFMNEDY